MIKRVCLFAGPDSGKTTMASGLFNRFKKLHYKVEYVVELARQWNFEGRPIVCASDQLALFAHQKLQEEIRLRAGCRFVITDCPILMGLAYSKKYNIADDVPGMIIQEKAFEEKYPSLNIFLDRKRNPDTYTTIGRYQANHFDAEEMDKRILDEFNLTGRQLYHFKFDDEDGIFNFVKERIDATN